MQKGTAPNQKCLLLCDPHLNPQLPNLSQDLMIWFICIYPGYNFVTFTLGYIFSFSFPKNAT